LFLCSSNCIITLRYFLCPETQHNKKNCCHTKWRKTENISSKTRNETKVSTLSTLIQHSHGIPSQINKIRRRNKRNKNCKGSSQTIPFCRRQDLISKRSNSTKKLLDIINSVSKVTLYNINLQGMKEINGGGEVKYDIFDTF
jgi:hypothetical protein